MIGTKIQATTVITLKVSRLEVASHIVRLASGVVLDGMTNGNMVIPAVRITQAMVSEEDTNASAALLRRENRMVSSGRTTPNAGIAHRPGIFSKLASHAPATCDTVLRSGSDGPA